MDALYNQIHDDLIREFMNEKNVSIGEAYRATEELADQEYSKQLADLVKSRAA